MNGRIVKKSFFCNLLVMFMVLFSSNSLITQNIFSLKAMNIVNFIIVCVAFFCIKKKKMVINFNNLKIVISLLAFMFITMLFTFDLDNFGGYLLIALQIIQMFLLVNIFAHDEIHTAYINALLHIAVSSIVVTYLLPIGGFEQYLPKIVNINGLKFSWILFAAKLNASGSFGIRNYGIFSEPAAYNFYLFIAMYFTLRMNFGLKKKTILLFLFAFVSFTTMSPIGMVIGLGFVCIISAMILKEGSGSDKTLLTALFVVTISLFSMVAVFNDAYYYILNKINVSSGSGLGRSKAILANLSLWWDRPLFGSGLKEISSLTSTLGSNTSTSGVMLACFGTIFSCIVFAAQGINIWLSCNMKTVFKIMVIVLFFLVINNYGFIQAEWYWFFCFKSCSCNKTSIRNS